MAKEPDLALVLDAGPPKGKRPPPMMSADEDEDEVPMSEPELSSTPELEEAAGAVNAALSSGDNAEIAKTLKGFIKLCGEY
jgi:hypothetical protein